jgi:hypothetical protein
MRIEQTSRQGCVVLTLAGRLDVAAVPQLQRVILKQLAEHPPAIICHLGQMEGSIRCAPGCSAPSAIPPWAGQAQPWCCARSGRRWPPPCSIWE